MNELPNDPALEADDGCGVCHKEVESCVCPVCPVCQVQGNARCYAVHGLRVTATVLERILTVHAPVAPKPKKWGVTTQVTIEVEAEDEDAAILKVESMLEDKGFDVEFTYNPWRVK